MSLPRNIVALRLEALLEESDLPTVLEELRYIASERTETAAETGSLGRAIAWGRTSRRLEKTAGYVREQWQRAGLALREGGRA